MRFSLRTLFTIVLAASAYYAGRAPMLHRVERAERERDLAVRAPEIIPLYYADAQSVAKVIRQVFGQPFANQSSPSPVLGVDRRSNSIIVSASRPVFVEVRAIASALDKSGSLKSARPAIVPLYPVGDRPLRSIDAGMAADALEHEQRIRDALIVPDLPGQR
jgi:hypothetical protein